MTASVLEARALQHSLGGRPVITGFDGQLRAGELVGLLGANGSGKSTLLRLLGGLLPPDQGEVLLDSRSLSDLTAARRARRIAWLAQTRHCPWPLRVDELVALGRLPHRAPWASLTDADQAAVSAALRACEVEDMRHRLVTSLSGGELARVLLARALSVGADVLLADEPVAGLDPAHQLQVMQTLHEQARQGRAVLVVLHDLSLARRYCDRLWLLHEGHLIASGEPDAVLSDAHLATAFCVTVLRDAASGMLQPLNRLETRGE